MKRIDSDYQILIENVVTNKRRFYDNPELSFIKKYNNYDYKPETEKLQLSLRFMDWRDNKLLSKQRLKLILGQNETIKKE